MKYKVEMLLSAQKDILLSAKWYKKKQKGLGKTFIQRIKEARKLLSQNPHFFNRYKNFRTLPLKQFPFLIHFVIDEGKKVVTIYAVLHTSLSTDNYPGQ